MRRVLAALSILSPVFNVVQAQSLVTLSPEVRQYVSVDAPTVALTHVRLIDGTGGPIIEDQTVVIASGKIQTVGRSAAVQAPAGARVLDLTGQTVMPGMVGLHNHTYQYFGPRWVQLQYSSPRLYLGSGVTTIRPTGSANPYADLELKAAIERGEIPGPRMHLTGPYLTGEHNYGGLMHHVKTPEQARKVVAYWADEGVEWFKAYTSITRAELGAAIDEAHKRGVKVTAHLCSVTAREAVALGIDNLEHGFFVNTDYDPEKVPDQCPANREQRLADVDINSEAVRQTFREMIQRNVPMTSTLAAVEYVVVPYRVPRDERVLEALSPEHQAQYLEHLQSAQASRGPENSPSEIIFRKAMQYEVAFVKAGGLLAAGMDPVRFNLAGFGDQRDYELLIQAGLTPSQVVQILSANGAKVLGVSENLGTVTPGKLADLVVINGNPVANPSDIKKVTLVFKDGVGYDAVKLIQSVKGQVGLQ